MLATLEPLGST